MKYRAITMAVIQEHGRPLQSFSNSMDKINEWAHTVAKKHDVDVKVFETYERVLTIVKKPPKSKTVVATAPTEPTQVVEDTATVIYRGHRVCTVCGHPPPCPFHKVSSVPPKEIIPNG